MLEEHVRVESLRDTEQPDKLPHAHLCIRVNGIHIRIGLPQEQATHNGFPYLLWD